MSEQERIVAELQSIARDEARLDQLWVDIVIAAMELQFVGQEPLR